MTMGEHCVELRLKRLSGLAGKRQDKKAELRVIEDEMAALAYCLHEDAGISWARIAKATNQHPSAAYTLFRRFHRRERT